MDGLTVGLVSTMVMVAFKEASGRVSPDRVQKNRRLHFRHRSGREKTTDFSDIHVLGPKMFSFTSVVKPGRLGSPLDRKNKKENICHEPGLNG